MTPDKSVSYLNSFINYERTSQQINAGDFKLDRVRVLLDALGNPQDALKIIHVAGSKGKGSTCVMTAHILKTCGYKVGLYTSPHIYSYKERIRVLTRHDSTQTCQENQIFPDSITDEEIQHCLQTLKPNIKRIQSDADLGDFSFFEVYTVLALYYFAQRQTDIVVLETGLGGRLDATNVVESLIAVITNISLEHTHILGADLKSIAQEKAGIIKSNTKKVIVSSQEKEVQTVLFQYSVALGKSPVFVDDYAAGRVIEQNKKWQSIDVTTPTVRYADLNIPLLGRHQMDNALTAITVAESLNDYAIDISKEAVYQGLSEVVCPIRFEVIPGAPYIVLDGAHNQSSVDALVKTMNEVFPGKTVHVILGVSEDKDIDGICRGLNEIARTVIVAKANHPRGKIFEQDELKDLFPGRTCFKVRYVQQAIKLARDRARLDGIILITGSLFLAGEARKFI